MPLSPTFAIVGGEGDKAEIEAIKQVFGDSRPALTTNKWKLGHSLATSGLLSVELALMMIEKQKFENEMEIASEIQQNLLPKKLPEYSSLDLNAFYRPAKQVGGDYYDFIQISDSKLGIVAADVTGKSVSGSLGMTIFRTTCAKSFIRLELVNIRFRLLLRDMMEF